MGNYMESTWNPYGLHSGYGMKKRLGSQSKNSPYGVHGMGLESIHSIWKIPGSVKTSKSVCWTHVFGGQLTSDWWTRGPQDVDMWPKVGGGGQAELQRNYYICFKILFLRPCSNVKHISHTSNTVGHLITYKRTHSAQLNRIFAAFVIIIHALDEATLFIKKFHHNGMILMSWNHQKIKTRMQNFYLGWNPAELLTQIVAMDEFRPILYTHNH